MMNWLTKTSLGLKNVIALVSFITISLMLGCGGSSDPFNNTNTTTGGGTTTQEITVSLQLVSQSTGAATGTVTSSNPARVIATVSGASSSVIVTFSTDVAVIPVPTAITDSSNQATVDLIAGSTLGAGTVTATVDGADPATIVYAVGATNVRMGSGTPFVENVAQVATAQISAGGTTTVSVTIVDDAGAVFVEPVDVNFSSACTTAGTSTLSSPVTTVNGVASSTYLAQGCVGDDGINVTANAGGINLSANGSVNVLGADAGSVEFVSATPENIAIQGAGGIGGSESSIIVFRVRDTNGNPVNGSLVNFELNTEQGGIEINPSSATTNSDGLVQTVINSGTVATTVRVTASIDSTTPAITTQSSNLVVSTGIPDQDSFTLSAETLNPEAWNIDRQAVNITATLSDAFNNPVPDGTAVSFTTEGGSIDSSCTTTDGTCTVVWLSANPRPEGETLSGNGALPEVSNTLGQKYGGRVTILATAIGEESFPDTNSNGLFDSSEQAAFAGNNVSGRPYDLNEAFVDHNEDGVFNPAIAGEAGGELETSLDFNNNGAYDSQDGEYNGVLCGTATNCSTTQSTNVRASIVLVMSGSNPELAVSVTRDAPAADDNDAVVNIQGESTGFATVIISDLHNQPMPAGTKITFTPSVGSIVGPSSYEWPNDNHNGGLAFSVSIKGTTTPKSGSLVVEVETPSGLKTAFSPITINITL
ncbi:MAG: Ig-like domain-containing protein [Kangiellaceae bacterium]